MHKISAWFYICILYRYYLINKFVIPFNITTSLKSNSDYIQFQVFQFNTFVNNLSCFCRSISNIERQTLTLNGFSTSRNVIGRAVSHLKLFVLLNTPCGYLLWNILFKTVNICILNNNVTKGKTSTWLYQYTPFFFSDLPELHVL